MVELQTCENLDWFKLVPTFTKPVPWQALGDDQKYFFQIKKKVKNILRNYAVNPLRGCNWHFLFCLTLLPDFTSEFEQQQVFPEAAGQPGVPWQCWVPLADAGHDPLLHLMCSLSPATGPGLLWVIINSFYGIFQWLGIKGSLHVPSLTSEGIRKLHMSPLMDG